MRKSIHFVDLYTPSEFPSPNILHTNVMSSCSLHVQVSQHKIRNNLWVTLNVVTKRIGKTPDFYHETAL